MEHARGVLVGYSHLLADPGAGGHEYGLVALVEELLKALHRTAGLYIDAKLFDVADFVVEGFFGQAVVRDAVAQQPAGFGGGLENGYRVAFLYQVVGGGQSGRAGADNGYLVFFGPLDGGGLLAAGVHFVVGHETLQRAY